MPEPARRIDKHGSAPGVPAGWIRSRDAAVILKVSERTISRRVDCGRIRGAMCRGPSGRELWIDPASDGDLAAVYAPAMQDECTGRELAELSACQRVRAAARMKAVADWLGVRDRLPAGASMKDAFDEWSGLYALDAGLSRPISWTTMWRWVRAHESGRGLVDLAPKAGGPPSANCDERAWAFFQTLYLAPQRRTVKDCWRQTMAAAARAKWAWISYAACRRKIETIPKATRVLYRQGRKACADLCGPYVERDYTSIASNDWWVVDHHQFDVAVISPAGRPAFPWLTNWMDVHSRRPMCRMIGFQPNMDVVLASLRRAMLGYGVPANMLFDNGKEFRAREVTGGRACNKVRVDVDEAHVRAALAHLPVQAHFAQAYNARAKPNERFFRTVRMQFSQQWDTYRGGSTADRPEDLDKLLRDYRQNGIVPTLGEFEAAYGQWEDEVYCKTPHRGQGMEGRSPDQAYKADLKRVVRVDEQELILLMMRTSRPLTVQRNGLRMFGRWFNSPELFAYLGKRVYARYDTAEIGRLYVHDLADRLICVACRSDLLAWGAKSDDVRKRLKVQRQHKKFAAAYAETSDLLTGDALKNIALQRQAAQQAAGGSGGGDDGGGNAAGRPAAQPTIVAFRSALADTREGLRRIALAAGAEDCGLGAGRPAAREFLRAGGDAEIHLPTCPQPRRSAENPDNVFDQLEL